MSEAVAHHDEHARDFLLQYDRSPDFRERLAIWKQLIERHTPTHGSALDLGCGGGAIAFELAARGLDTIGVDGAPAMLRIGEERAARAARKPRFVQALLPDGYTGPPADVVVASSVLEYLAPTPAVDAWLASLVAPRGVLIFSLPNRTSWFRAWERLRFRLTGRPAYRRLLKQEGTADSLARRFERHGFRLVETRTHGFAPWLARAGAALSEHWGGTMLVAAFRRDAA